jgi:hypothetical protein
MYMPRTSGKGAPTPAPASPMQAPDMQARGLEDGDIRQGIDRHPTKHKHQSHHPNAE